LSTETIEVKQNHHPHNQWFLDSSGYIINLFSGKDVVETFCIHLGGCNLKYL